MGVCSQNEVVKWGHMHQLALYIESIADAMQVSVTKLTTDPISPFSMSKCPDMEAAYTFSMQLGTNLVGNDWISTSLGRWTQFWQPPNDAVRDLITKRECLFIHPEDDCWCTLGWWIRQNGALYNLEEVDPTQCCPSLKIPGALDSKQTWVSSAHVSRWVPEGYYKEMGDRFNLEAPRCRKDDSGGEIGLLIKSRAGLAPSYWIEYGGRALKGYITWLIVPRYYQQLYDMILDIIDGSCGAQIEAVKRAETTQYVCPMGAVRMVDILWTLQEEGYLDKEPGCIREENCEIPLPWEEKTCGGEDCAEAGLKLYCKTLEDLTTIAGEIPRLLYAKNHKGICGGMIKCAGNKHSPSECNADPDTNVSILTGSVLTEDDIPPGWSLASAPATYYDDELTADPNRIDFHITGGAVRSLGFLNSPKKNSGQGDPTPCEIGCGAIDPGGCGCLTLLINDQDDRALSELSGTIANVHGWLYYKFLSDAVLEKLSAHGLDGAVTSLANIACGATWNLYFLETSNNHGVYWPGNLVGHSNFEWTGNGITFLSATHTIIDDIEAWNYGLETSIVKPRNDLVYQGDGYYPSALEVGGQPNTPEIDPCYVAAWSPVPDWMDQYAQYGSFGTGVLKGNLGSCGSLNGVQAAANKLPGHAVVVVFQEIWAQDQPVDREEFPYAAYGPWTCWKAYVGDLEYVLYRYCHCPEGVSGFNPLAINPGLEDETFDTTESPCNPLAGECE